jgi:hypothetical protein
MTGGSHGAGGTTVQLHLTGSRTMQGPEKLTDVLRQCLAGSVTYFSLAITDFGASACFQGKARQDISNSSG